MLSSVGKRSTTLDGAPGRGARDPNFVSFSHHFAITVRDRINYSVASFLMRTGTTPSFLPNSSSIAFMTGTLKFLSS